LCICIYFPQRSCMHTKSICSYIIWFMLVFVLYIVKQVNKSIHLTGNLIKIVQMKFQHLISCKQVFFNFEKLFHKDLNYYPFHLKVIIFLYISLVVSDITVNKLVVFFFLACSFMLMYLTIILKILWSIVTYLSLNFSISSFVKITNLGRFLDHNNPWSWAKPMDWNSII